MSNKKLIVPVCRGNIARSPVAEIIIRREIEVRGLHDQYEVLSRGTQGVALDDKEPAKFRNITFYHDEYNDLQAWLDERNIDLTSHTSTPIDINVAEHASIILAMDKRTQQALLALFPDYAKKIHMFSELIDEEKEIINSFSSSVTSEGLFKLKILSLITLTTFALGNLLFPLVRSSS